MKRTHLPPDEKINEIEWRNKQKKLAAHYSRIYKDDNEHKKSVKELKSYFDNPTIDNLNAVYKIVSSNDFKLHKTFIKLFILTKSLSKFKKENKTALQNKEIAIVYVKLVKEIVAQLIDFMEKNYLTENWLQLSGQIVSICNLLSNLGTFSFNVNFEIDANTINLILYDLKELFELAKEENLIIDDSHISRAFDGLQNLAIHGSFSSTVNYHYIHYFLKKLENAKELFSIARAFHTIAELYGHSNLPAKKIHQQYIENLIERAIKIQSSALSTADIYCDVICGISKICNSKVLNHRLNSQSINALFDILVSKLSTVDQSKLMLVLHFNRYKYMKGKFKTENLNKILSHLALSNPVEIKNLLIDIESLVLRDQLGDDEKINHQIILKMLNAVRQSSVASAYEINKCVIVTRNLIKENKIDNPEEIIKILSDMNPNEGKLISTEMTNITASSSTTEEINTNNASVLPAELMSPTISLSTIKPERKPITIGERLARPVKNPYEILASITKEDGSWCMLNDKQIEDKQKEMQLKYPFKRLSFFSREEESNKTETNEFDSPAENNNMRMTAKY